MAESSDAKLSSNGVRATLLSCLFFAGFGALIPHLPTWLDSAQGFTGVQISLVLTIGGLSRIIIGPITAAWAAGQADKRAPLFLFAFLLSVGFGALWFVEGFWPVFAIILLMDVGFWGLLPAVEAALIRLTKTGLPPYGFARGLASAAFIVGSSSVGALVTDFGPWAIWAWLLGVSITLIGAAFVMPREPVLGNEEGDFIGRLKEGVGLLKNRRFALLIFAAGILQATHGYFYGFGVLIWTKDQAISQTVAGNLWSVGVAVEVLFLMFLGGWSSKFASETLILVGAIACIIRWTAMAFLPPEILLWPLQVLHAGTFAAVFLGAMRLVNQMMGDEQTATAQMIYMALASAPAQAFTTFVSGYLYDALVADGDAALGYLAMTGVSVVGLVLSLMLWVTREKPGTQLATT
ncbi:MFS transporter [Sandarakinorhabdus sp.]|uniref:MFS transporter n=1 Tax=Sandarakinorhabdus sp. TaxID=1916663 RepID=UPI00286D77BB|nr:MFS transporter [Sandarakinorhabdus sp.]